MALLFGPSDTELAAVEEDLGYKFQDKWLLKQAFIHPSVGDFNNNRFAWIGDAIMHLTVSHMILDIATPTVSTTGILEDRRKIMVTRKFCAEQCNKLGWGGLAAVGKGFANAHDATTNMLAEIFEAVWGAVFIDSGFSYPQLAKCYKKVLPPENLVSIFEELEVTRRAEVEAQRAREKAPNKRAKREIQRVQLGLAIETTTPENTIPVKVKAEEAGVLRPTAMAEEAEVIRPTALADLMPGTNC